MRSTGPRKVGATASNGRSRISVRVARMVEWPSVRRCRRRAAWPDHERHCRPDPTRRPAGQVPRLRACWFCRSLRLSHVTFVSRCQALPLVTRFDESCYLVVCWPSAGRQSGTRRRIGHRDCEARTGRSHLGHCRHRIWRAAAKERRGLVCRDLPHPGRPAALAHHRPSRRPVGSRHRPRRGPKTPGCGRRWRRSCGGETSIATGRR